MRFLTLALKDLSQMAREKQALLFLVVMPVAFTFFMGIAYRGGSQASDTRLALAWVNHNPGGLAGKTLAELLSQSDVVRLETVDPRTSLNDLNEGVRSGTYAGVLIVPPDFSRSVLKGKDKTLTLITNETSTNGQSVMQAVRAALSRLLSSVKIADLVADSLKLEDESATTSAFEDAVAAWKPSNRGQLSYSLEKLEGGVTVNSALAQNPYKQSSPGMLVQFAVFGLVTSATILVDERKSRTLQRLMTTSLSSAEIIAGHMLAMFCLVLAQASLLVLFGQLILKVDYFRQPLAILLVLVALSLWVAALGLLIGVLAADESRVVLYSLVAMFLFSGLGGVWFPLETVGSAFATAGHLAPTFYAMQGLQNILVREQGFSSVLVPAMALLLFALLFFGLALWRFRRSVQH
jgi:ABC-2 type transport system permease protein